jgi:hypothetical protein
LVGRFDRLAVNNGCRGGHVAAFGETQPIAQGVVDERPGPILAPLAKVAIDGFARSQSLWAGGATRSPLEPRKRWR